MATKITFVLFYEQFQEEMYREHPDWSNMTVYDEALKAYNEMYHF